MLAKTQDNEEIIARVAALDIGKAELVCCVRVPDEDRRGRRLQEVETYSTMTRSLLGMADRLACLGVTRVVMEATSDYWKPVFYLLEAAGFETWLVNAKDVKHLPGRPKTDRLDCIWLCKVSADATCEPMRAILAGQLPSAQVADARSTVCGSEGGLRVSWPHRHVPVMRSTAVTTSLSGIVVLIS